MLLNPFCPRGYSHYQKLPSSLAQTSHCCSSVLSPRITNPFGLTNNSISVKASGHTHDPYFGFSARRQQTKASIKSCRIENPFYRSNLIHRDLMQENAHSNLYPTQRFHAGDAANSSQISVRNPVIKYQSDLFGRRSQAVMGREMIDTMADYAVFMKAHSSLKRETEQLKQEAKSSLLESREKWESKKISQEEGPIALAQIDSVYCLEEPVHYDPTQFPEPATHQHTEIAVKGTIEVEQKSKGIDSSTQMKVFSTNSIGVEASSQESNKQDFSDVIEFRGKNYYRVH